jgi:hypothetical protein
VSSLEFLDERFIATCSKGTLINEWDAQWTEISEGVHSLGWVCQKEESWRKFEINVGEKQWDV